jgi:hypothetical protein
MDFECCHVGVERLWKANHQGLVSKPYPKFKLALPGLLCYSLTKIISRKLQRIENASNCCRAEDEALTGNIWFAHSKQICEDKFANGVYVTSNQSIFS